jgi:hypothetical protein
MTQELPRRLKEQNKEQPITADEALVLSEKEWLQTLQSLDRNEQIALADSILKRIQKKRDLSRFRELCSTAGKRKEQNDDQS